MLMPPSDKTIVGLIGISAGNAVGSVDSCSVDMSNVAPNVFNGLTVGSGTVQTTIGLNFNLILSIPLMQTD